MRARLTLAASLVLAGAALIPAQASIAPSPVNRSALATFNRLDRNGDGGISRAELRPLGRQKAADALFALLDIHGDGKIRLADIAKRANPALLSRFRAYDARNLGVVTRRDFPNFVDPALFAALDTDHDGELSLAELRPDFAGSRVRHAPPEEQPPAPPAQPPAEPLCWVPIIGGGSGPRLEFPVPFSEGCRVQ